VNNSRDTFEQLRKSFDGSDPFMTHGHQILKIRRSSRSVPKWTKNDKSIQEVVLRAFPKMATDPKQRGRAGRWIRVIHLYYRMKMTKTQVAAELCISPDMIHDILVRIRRVQAGVRSDNRGKHGVVPRGRPKKSRTL
jgi:hypothetical protein